MLRCNRCPVQGLHGRCGLSTSRLALLLRSLRWLPSCRATSSIAALALSWMLLANRLFLGGAFSGVDLFKPWPTPTFATTGMAPPAIIWLFLLRLFVTHSKLHESKQVEVAYLYEVIVANGKKRVVIGRLCVIGHCMSICLAAIRAVAVKASFACTRCVDFRKPSLSQCSMTKSFCGLASVLRCLASSGLSRQYS